MPPATSSAQALSQLQQAQSTAQNPNDILGAQRQQLGVNAAQQTVTGLQGAINNTTNLLNKVAPSVMGRTAQSLVTNAQATRQIGNEQAPINQQLSKDTSAYNQANQDLSTKEKNAELAAQGIYQGQKDKMSYLQNLYNTLYGSEKDKAAADAAAADKAEQIREFNAGLSFKSSGGGRAPSAAETKQAAVGGISSQLGKLTGSDGKVSEQTWQGALNDAVAAGFTPQEFWQQFGQYVNKKYANTYAGYQSGYGNKYTS